MNFKFRPLSPTSSGVVLLSLLLAGCATEKAVLNQTQPLHEQIDRIEHTLSAASEAGLRASEMRAEKLALRQSELEKQLTGLQSEIGLQQDKIKALELQSAEMLSHLNGKNAALSAGLLAMEKQLRETTVQTQATALQNADLQSRLLHEANVGATVTAGIADAKLRIDETNRLAQAAARETSRQANALQNRQDAAESVNAALNQRLRAAEEKLTTLSGLVQEALALAAKEIFLANGKEAFTVTLTEDKVLYPQNDPNLGSRDTAKLNELAGVLVKLDQEYHLDIQGHTDNNSTEDNNYSLGKARAEVVKRYLYEKQGISINRMSTISYGANKPLDNGKGDNRRIFIRVLVLK